jgi:hypothetical protein
MFGSAALAALDPADVVLACISAVETSAPSADCGF